jgi:hypothetical protein
VENTASKPQVQQQRYDFDYLMSIVTKEEDKHKSSIDDQEQDLDDYVESER